MRRHPWEGISQLFKVSSRIEDLTLKQVFDVTAQLVINQDEINGPDKIVWEKYFLIRLSLVGDESHQFPTHKSLPSRISSTSRIQRSLEEQSCRNPIREKLQRR